MPHLDDTLAQTDMVQIGINQLLYSNQGTHSQPPIRMSASDDVTGAHTVMLTVKLFAVWV